MTTRPGDGRDAPAVGDPQCVTTSASRSGRRRTAATRWPWRTTRSITPRCSTARRAPSGRGRISGRWWEGVLRDTAGMTQPQADRALAAPAGGCSAERPSAFARASASRLGRFWGLAPAGAVYPRALRIATACWTFPLWLGLAWGLSRRDAWRWPRLAAPATVLALTIVHAFYWTDLRMRAPIVPAIALIAAGGLSRGRPCEPTSA